MFEYISPFPFINSENKLADGLLFEQPSYCRKKCFKHGCRNSISGENQHYECEFGFSCFKLISQKSPYILNGLIVNELNTKLDRLKRKQFKANKISMETISLFLQNVSSLNDKYDDCVNKSVVDNISFLVTTQVSNTSSYRSNQRGVLYSQGY